MVILDSEVIKRIKQGEIDNFSFIIEKYSGKIVRYIKAKLFNKLDVDDLVQNTFVSFYKAIHRFDESKPIGPYLYKIAMNELKMYYRSHKTTVPLHEDSELFAHEGLFYIEDYGQDSKTLSNEQKTVLELLQKEYSYKEIAQKIKRPINTVRTIIRRTRLQMKKNYGTA
jgi:RNA polymerase sigma-70 factor, ECF subfamily